MFKIILMIAVATTGFIEYLKKFMPAKVTESKVALAGISGAVSTIVGAAYVTLAWFVNNIGLPLFSTSNLIVNYVLVIVATVSLVQLSYNVLLQTFKAVKEKLKAKVVTPTIDPETASDEIVDAITEKVTEEIGKVVSEATKKK